VAQTVFEKAEEFFRRIPESAEGRRELGRQDQVIQFEVRDGEPFWLEIRGGRLSLNRGLAAPDSIAVRYTADAETLIQLFEGRVRFVDVAGVGRRRLLISPAAAGRGTIETWLGKLFRIGQGLPKTLLP